MLTNFRPLEILVLAQLSRHRTCVISRYQPHRATKNGIFLLGLRSETMYKLKVKSEHIRLLRVTYRKESFWLSQSVRVFNQAQETVDLTLFNLHNHRT